MMVTIRRIGSGEAGLLARLLNRDGTLRRELGFPPDTGITPGEFEKKIRDWETVQDSVCYCILENEKPVGMISLSHIDLKRARAGAGYWIGSRYRNRGICSAAFRLIMDVARGIGLASLSATVAAGNGASRAIWEREGARGELKADGKMSYTLDLMRNGTSMKDEAASGMKHHRSG